jgi:hypothetical protein
MVLEWIRLPQQLEIFEPVPFWKKMKLCHNGQEVAVVAVIFLFKN